MTRNTILLAAGLLLALAGLSFLFQLDGLALLLLITSAAVALKLFDDVKDDDSGWRPLLLRYREFALLLSYVFTQLHNDTVTLLHVSSVLLLRISLFHIFCNSIVL